MGIYEDTLFAADSIDPFANQQAGLTVNYSAGLSTVNKKKDRLDKRYTEKERRLRKDDENYGTDGTIVSTAKNIWNALASHDNQLAVNYEGKRYNTQNKIFNEQDSTDLNTLWNSYENNPQGDKSLYYLRRADGINADGSTKWQYKTGIAEVSASDRYRGQIAQEGYDIVAEKRFDAASTFEKEVHGSQVARDNRSYDYGQYRNDSQSAANAGVAYSDFGAGTSELYDADILGLDTGTAEDYAKNKALSNQAMAAADAQPWQRNDTFESVDAFQAATVTLAGKGIKAVGQGISALIDDDEVTGDGVIEAYGKSLMEDANKIAGYNPKTMVNATKDMAQGWREGNPFQFMSGLLRAAPQAVAGSVPESALYFGTGGTGLALKGSLLAMNVNNTLDEREKANGGRKSTKEEIAAVTFGEGFALAIDAASLKFVLKGMPGLPVLGIMGKGGKPIDFQVAMKSMDKSTKVELAKSLGMGLARGTGAFATEAVQETTTEAIRMLTETLGTDKYKDQDAGDILTGVEGTHRLRDSLLLGGAGGLGFGAPTNISQTAKSMAKDLKTGRRLDTGEIAGQNAENTQDAEAKKIYAEERLVEAEASVNAINASIGSVDNAKTIAEVKTALEASLGTTGLIGPEIVGTINGLSTLKESDLLTAKENAYAALNNTNADLIIEAKANKKALEGLDASIATGDKGEQLNKGLEEVGNLQSEVTSQEEELAVIQAETNRINSDFKISSKLELDKYELDRNQDLLTEETDKDKLSEIANTIANLKESIAIGTEASKGKITTEQDTIAANDKLASANVLFQDKLEEMKKAVRSSKSPELEELYTEMETTRQSIVDLQSKIDNSQGKTEVMGLEKKLAADRKRLEDSSRKLLDISKERAEKYVEPETQVGYGRKEKKKAAKANREPISTETKKSKLDKKKAKQKFNEKQSQLDVKEAELESKYASDKSSYKETKKDILEAKKLDEEATKTDRTHLEINSGLANSTKKEIDKIEAETDEAAARAYDPVGEEVMQVTETAEKIGKAIKPTAKKKTLARKFMRGVLSIIPGIDGNKEESTRTGFSEELAKVSTAALKLLNEPSAISEMDAMMVGKGGYKPFTKQMVKDAVEKEMHNRNISDAFFAKGAEISGSQRKFTNPLEAGDALKEAKAIRDVLTSGKLTIEQDEEAGRDYINAVKEVLESVKNMDIVEKRRFIQSGPLKDSFNDVVTWLATTNNEQANKVMMDDIETFNRQADGTLDTQSRKKFLFKIARSKITEDADAIKAAREDVEYLVKENVLTEKQAATMRNALDDVAERSQKNNVAYQNEIAKANMLAVEGIDAGIKADPNMDEAMKERILDFNEGVKIQIMNAFGAFDNAAIDHLESLGFDLNEAGFTKKDGKITITIC